jgi:segregation and condensation protein B
MEENISIKNTAELDTQIESLLFYFGEPVKISKLAKILEKTEDQIKDSLSILENKLSNRGLNISKLNDEVVLITNNQNSELIKKIRKEELNKDLSKAALETLSIIIYRGPIRRSEIDYIRGVNSQFILRLLLVRGLIEKVTDPKDERSYLYKSSFDLLNSLGLKNISDMPEFEKVNQDIEKFINQDSEEINNNEI